jgi:hypothetical protein
MMYRRTWRQAHGRAETSKSLLTIQIKSHRIPSKSILPPGQKPWSIDWHEREKQECVDFKAANGG